VSEIYREGEEVGKIAKFYSPYRKEYSEKNQHTTFKKVAKNLNYKNNL